MLTSNNSLNSLIATSLQQVYSTLNNFAKGDDFLAKIQSIFGTNFDASKLEEIRQQWINSNFTSLPPIEIRSGSELQGANAAYAGSNNTIYVSQDFLTKYTDNLQAITSVLLEEIGHSVDWHINTSDTPGDEGEFFSNVVQGISLSEGQIQSLKQENDFVDLSLTNHNENKVQIEQSSSNNSSNNYDWDFNSVFNAIVNERGKSQVVYMNGIWNSHEGATIGFNLLKETLHLNNAPSMDVYFQYNETKDGDFPPKNGQSIEDGYKERVKKFNSLVKEQLYDIAIKEYDAKLNELKAQFNNDPTLQSQYNYFAAFFNAQTQAKKLSRHDHSKTLSAYNILNNITQGSENWFDDHSDSISNSDLVDFLEDFKAIENFVKKDNLNSDKYVDSDIAEVFIQHIAKEKVNLSDKVNDQWVEKDFSGKKSLIFLGHSQGNLFFEDALLKKVFAPPVQVVAIASPTNYSAVANNPNVNFALLPKNGTDFIPDLQVDVKASDREKFDRFFVGLLSKKADIWSKISLANHTLKGWEPSNIGNIPFVGGYMDNSDIVNSAKTSISNFLDKKNPGAYYFAGKIGSGSWSETDLSDWLKGDFTYTNLEGKKGNDLLEGSNQNDKLTGNQGWDFLDGGGGKDSAFYWDNSYGITVTMQENYVDKFDMYRVNEGYQQSGKEVEDILINVEEIFGSPKNDKFYGGSGDDYFYGESGDDKVYGKAGNDFADDESGNDYFEGNSGNDTFYGGNDNDEGYGGTGNDVRVSASQSLLT